MKYSGVVRAALVIDTQEEEEPPEEPKKRFNCKNQALAENASIDKMASDYLQSLEAEENKGQPGKSLVNHEYYQQNPYQAQQKVAPAEETKQAVPQ